MILTFTGAFYCASAEVKQHGPRKINPFQTESESENSMKLKRYASKPYFSTLTGKYYPDYDTAFRESRRAGGGAYCDFNICYINPDGTVETVF